MHDRPNKSRELLVLKSLVPRMELSKEYKQRFENLEKGYEGEMKFYQHVQKTALSSQAILYDLLLPSNQTEFQLDSLLLSKNKILLFEIKNFEGDLYIQEDNWYVASTKKEIKNPFLQLNRSEFYLRNLLRQWGYPSLLIEPYLIFVHSEFILYQAPLSQTIIFPTQLKRFLHKLQADGSANTSQPIAELKSNFIKHHLPHSFYEQLPI